MKNVILVTLLLLIGSVVVGAPLVDPISDNPIVSVFDYQDSDHCAQDFILISPPPPFECVVYENTNDATFESDGANDNKRSEVEMFTLNEFQFSHVCCNRNLTTNLPFKYNEHRHVNDATFESDGANDNKRSEVEMFTLNEFQFSHVCCNRNLTTNLPFKS